MLKPVLIAALLGSLLAGQAMAAPKKDNPPPGQSEPKDRESDERAPRGFAAEPAAPPAALAPAPASRFIVLTEQQKRCGVRRQCEVDSRVPCPPCW